MPDDTTPDPDDHEGVTLETYSAAKQLPIQFLERMGLRQQKYLGKPAIRIQYFPLGGSEPSIRFRVKLSGKDKMRWRKGDRTLLYGAWFIGEFVCLGYVVLVEGESDCHTAWLYEFPALGLPGASMWNEARDAPLLADFPKLYAVIEPDTGGETMLTRFAHSAIAPRLWIIRMPPGIKDVSELYLADREGFPAAFRALLDGAEPFQPPNPQLSEAPGNNDDDRPNLVVCDSDLPSTARALRDLFIASADLFDRGTPVKLVRDAVSKTMVARQLTIDGVVHEAHRVARPVKLKEQDGAIVEVPVTLPNRVASLYLDMKGDWNLRVLNGITTAPILLEDGNIVWGNGYDQGTGLWCDAVATPPIPPMVPMPLAVAALLRLRTTFRTFPFADAPRVWDPALEVEIVDINQPPGQDESAFLIGLATAVCRASLWLAPGVLLVAPQISGSGTGKGLLVRATCIIAFGQLPRPFTAGHDRQELEKRISAALIEGRQELFLDNANNMFMASATLASAMIIRTDPRGQEHDFAPNLNFERTVVDYPSQWSESRSDGHINIEMHVAAIDQHP